MTPTPETQTDLFAWALELEQQRERITDANAARAGRRGYLVFATDPDLPPDSPDYRVLKARALMYMGLRPAALRSLGTPATAEQKHLFAVLNGNLPEVQSNRPGVAPGIRALIAMVEE